MDRLPRDLADAVPDAVTPRRIARACLALLVLLSAAYVVASAPLGGESQPTAKSELRAQADLPFAEREPVVPPRNGTTVVTTSPRKNTQGAIVAFAPDGRLRYYNDTNDKYFDVDPVPGTSHTVVYSAGRYIDAETCVGTERSCARNVFRRVNLSTGEAETLYAFDARSGIPHDVEWVNETHLLVAEGGKDRVFVVDTRTGLVTWEWQAQSHFSGNVGGVFPDDWSHINDVDPTGDGRYMVSVRNMDQVVFVDRRGRVGWTLGAEDDYDVLHEQHNPDYIPPARGGPAVLVADSENNRLVEYQRVESGAASDASGSADGRWVRTWVWRDARMQWPRDADRLPNGHTLVADSDGNRLLELDRDAEVVWSVDLDTPYEVERLGTGKGSTGGESARRLGLPSRGRAETTGDDGSGGAPATDDAGGPGGVRGLLHDAVLFAKGLVPSLVLNGLLFVLPPWVTVFELFAGLFGLAVLALWAVLELRWAGYALRLERPGDG